MAYQALYRKFRPPVFDDVKGQDHIVTTLRNQVTSGRVAHAYLFCGTRGTGKTSVAKIMARAVNCDHLTNGNPCGECEVCKATATGANLNVVEIDAASNNGVDNIREIVEEVAYSPTMGHYKVYIIDEAHMLSPGAFNALLKTLEEPPEYVIFILATTEVHRIPITILSRCQRYDFHRLTPDTIEARLKEVADKEGITIEDRALRYIARSADGAMRDGLSLLDRCLALRDKETLDYDTVLNVLGTVDTELFLRLFRTLYNADTSASLELIAEVVASGGELTQFAVDFVWFLRNLMLLHASDAAQDAIDVYADNYEEMKALCAETDLDTILHYLRVFSDLTAQMRATSQKRILLETCVVRICKPQMEAQASEALLDRRVNALEQELSRAQALLQKVRDGSLIPAAAQADEGTAAPEKKKVLERALPEDIRKVRDAWSKIMVSMPMPMRSYLQHARPSIAEDDTLLIVADTELNAAHFKDEPYATDLKDVLAKAVGKDVPFRMSFVPAHAVFEEHFINLDEQLHFPVETDAD